MYNFKYYHFLAAETDIKEGFEKIKRGEMLDREDEESLKNILDMVITFIAENETFIEKQ